jgi:hypothetical protein
MSLRNPAFLVCSAVIVVGWSATPEIAVAAQAVHQVKIPAGQTADLWLGVSVKGHVNYVIRTRDGSNRARLWWIVQPLGRVQQLGLLEGTGRLSIPSKVKGSVSATLRCKAGADTVVYIGENVGVDNSLTFSW